MDPKFQTSFIPKKPVLETGRTASTSRPKTGNIFSTLSNIILFVTIAVFAGAYGYKVLIIGQLNKVSQDLNSVRSDLKVDKIQDIIVNNSRIIATNNILEKHIVVSKLISSIQDTTLKRVRFLDFNYTNDGATPTLSMDTEASSYNTLAEQAAVFSKSAFLVNPKFSALSLGENGSVRAKFFATVDNKLISYKEVFGNTAVSNPVVETQPVATATQQ